MVVVNLETGKVTDEIVDPNIIAEVQGIPTFPTPNNETIDFKNNYNTAITRLKDIVTNSETYTNIQARDAIIDLAKIQLRLLLYLNNKI